MASNKDISNLPKEEVGMVNPSTPPLKSGRTPIVVESSEQDDRKYEILTLESNKLHVLLISDPDTDKASAALDVRVGHLSDPDNLPGLAHFLEHMLFMGTEKYPDENEYNSYLNTHGGSSNAYTDTESTNYYFDVGVDNLEGALDRFAQFFICPLFEKDATERELNAVDSEHAKNLQNDWWRLSQLIKSLSVDTHPYSKFGSGNLETLKNIPESKGLDVRKELLTFHERYYSANLMQLVVLGKQSLDELNGLVTKYFSSIPNKNLTAPVFPGKPFGSSSISKLLHVIPVKETRRVELNFPMREINTLYREKPTRYISHLIGHEGSGSILALLKKKGYANELSAGESRECSDWSMFSISIELTDAGLENVNEVVDIVFAYIALLQHVKPQEWVYEETATVANCGFRFLSKRHPSDYTCTLACNMQIYPEEHVLSGPYKIYEYDPESIEQCMSYLTPTNMIQIIMSRNAQTDSTEHYYSTQYSAQDVEPESVKRWQNISHQDYDLHLPVRNDLIATDFSLKTKDLELPKDEPKLLMDSDMCRLWYKPDNIFDMPKLNVIARIVSPVTYESPEASVLSFLWVQILQDHCVEFTYLAEMANLHISLVNARTGIEIHCGGYNQKLNVLMGKAIQAAVELPQTLTQDLFERIKDKASKQYANFFFYQPYQHAIYGGDLCLETHKWSIHDKIAALEDVTFEKIVSFTKSFLSRHYIEMLVHGNALPDEAVAIASTVINGLKGSPLLQSNLPQIRVIDLPYEKQIYHQFNGFNPENTNSCILSVYQIGPVDLGTNAVLAFLHHLIQEPAFNELRSIEQLGYIVHTDIKTSGDNIKSLIFIIQSDSFPPHHLDERVEAFLDRFRSTIVSMSEEEFQSNIDAVVQIFFEKNKNLSEESTRYWNAVTDKSYEFRKYILIGEHVRDSVSKNNVLQFFDKFVAKDAPKRKKFCTQVFGKNHELVKEEKKEDGVTVFSSDGVMEFKREMGLFPLAPSVNVDGFKME